MADRIKRLGLGIKLDTASVNAELGKLKSLLSETLKAASFTGSGTNFVSEIRAASSQLKQIKADLTAYQKTQAKEASRAEVQAAREANREIQALQKARIAQATAVNKSLTSTGGYSWLTGGMDANTRAQMIAHYKTLGQEAKQAQTSVVNLNSALIAASVVAGTVTSAFYTLKGVVGSALRMERITSSMGAVTSTATLAAREIQYIREEAERLGLVFSDTAVSFARFSAATRNTSVEGEQTRKIFSSVAEAATALKLSADETNGVFIALGQMMSKGKVQAEELRGQLGERLPGAFKLAAQAMGVSEAKLNKMMEDGKVLGSDLLPKLAVELHKTYGKAAVEAAKQGQAEINRFNNAVFEMKATLGEDLMPTLTSVLKELREWTPAVNLTIRAVKQLREEITSLPTGRRLLDLVPGLGQSDLADTVKMREQIQHMRDLINLAKPGSTPDAVSSKKSMLELSEEQKRTAAAKAREDADAKNNKKKGGSGLSAEKMSIAAIKEYQQALLEAKRSEYELQFHMLGNQKKLGYVDTDSYYNAAVDNAGKDLDYQLKTLENKRKAIEDAYTASMGKKNLTGDQKDALSKKYQADVAEVDRDEEAAKNEHYKKLSDLGTSYYLDRVKLLTDEAQHETNMQKLTASELVAQNQWAVEEQQKQIEWLYNSGALNCIQYYQKNGNLIEQNKAVALQALQVEWNAWKTLWDQKKALAQGKTEEILTLDRELEEKEKELANNVAQVNRNAATQTAENYRTLAGTINGVFGDAMKTGLKTFFDYSSDGFLDFRELALDVLNDIYNDLVEKFITSGIVDMITGGSSGGLGLVGSIMKLFTGSAKGNVFSTPGLKPYMNTVVDRPTVFAFAQGGIMGEAGKEAVMPLTRTSSGNLGVEATGSVVSPTVNVKIELVNKSGQELSAKQGQASWNATEIIVPVVIDAIERNVMGLKTMLGG